MKKVLFTRELSDFDLQLCTRLGIEPVIAPLVGIQPVELSEIRELPNLTATLHQATAIAFTSRHAVEALLGSMPSDPDDQTELFFTELIRILRKKPVYTVGESTADVLDAYGIMARFPEDYNGTVLAEMMLNDGVHSSVIHFCGDIRRPEFREALHEAGVAVEQIVVYRKKNRQIDVNAYAALVKSVQAVTFYAPSAVEAFWNASLHTHFKGAYYAIGHTTLSALESLGAAARVPNVPVSELLIRDIAKNL